jgi:hypothetical protein
VPSFAGLGIGGGCPRVIQRLPRAPPWATLCRPPRLVCGVGVCDEVGSRFSVASSTRNRRLCVNLENWSIWHIFRKSTNPYSRYRKAVLYDPGQNKCLSSRSRSRAVKRELHNGTLCAKIFRLKRCGENTWAYEEGCNPFLECSYFVTGGTRKEHFTSQNGTISGSVLTL